LHEYFGVKNNALKNLERSKKNEITYYEWMYLDTILWNISSKKGYVAKEDIERGLNKIQINEDMVSIARQLKKEGKIISIVSGGIDLLVKRLADAVRADSWVSNILVFDEKSRLVPGGIPLVPGGSKGVHLRRLKQKYNVMNEQTAFIGDSEWDREAFSESGLSILYTEYNGRERSVDEACVVATTSKEVRKAIDEYEKDLLLCK
jgi:phosphoserine phosphatase